MPSGAVCLRLLLWAAAAAAAAAGSQAVPFACQAVPFACQAVPFACGCCCGQPLLLLWAAKRCRLLAKRCRLLAKRCRLLAAAAVGSRCCCCGQPSGAVCFPMPLAQFMRGSDSQAFFSWKPSMFLPRCWCQVVGTRISVADLGTKLRVVFQMVTIQFLQICDGQRCS